MIDSPSTKRERDFVQQGDTHKSGSQAHKSQSLGDEAKTWLKRDANVFLHQALSTPVMNVLHSADGAYITDFDGNRYLDLHGNGVHNIGYNNKEVASAIIRQLSDELTFVPRRYTSRVTVKFAEKIVGMAPEGLDRILLCPGGSEAIEMAIMLAKHTTGKWKTISFWNQYHGNTFQAATLSGNEHFTTGLGPMVPGAFYVQYPNYYRNPWNINPEETEKIDECYLSEIRTIFKHNPDIAAVVGTTIASTPCIPSSYFWSEVRSICDEHDSFLIFDEIVCGLGRTGKLFACEHYVTPDVLVIGKALGGGILPLAGILTRDEYNTVSDFSIGHFTHEKSPVSTAASMAMLEYMEAHRLVENAKAIGDYLLDGFRQLQQFYPCIGTVQGKGLLICLDLIKDSTSKERHPKLANAILTYGLEHGLSFKIIDTNVITLRPSLIITKEEADFILDTFTAAFQQNNDQIK